MIEIRMKTLDAGSHGVRFAGQVLEVDEDEADDLVTGGYADYTTPPIAEVDGRLKHLGGGYYELPNGEKVRGKEKALEALNAIEAGDDANGADSDNGTGGGTDQPDGSQNTPES